MAQLWCSKNVKYLKKIEGVDYRFRDDVENDEGLTIIELLNGQYSGILYCYGRTNIETVDSENGVLKFQFKVLDTTEEEKEKYKKDKDFIQHIGEILNSIILDDMGINENWTNNIKEPYEKWGLYSESIALYQGKLFSWECRKANIHQDSGSCINI